MKTLHTVLAAVVTVGSIGLATHADAQTRWQAHHPWRTYDNARLRNQNERITQGVRDGQISHGQARALRSDDRAIRAEERADASLHGSHLDRQEERQIYRQENASSRAIYTARHD